MSTPGNTQRIAKNTIYLYIRSLFSLFVSLYSSRLILQALGADDYGTYNVVGGFVSMFWLVSGSLSTAVTRFLNFEKGRDDSERVGNVFSLSLNLMLLLSLAVLLLAESFGLWFFHHQMNIPAGRETAAFWVFQFSVLTVMSGFAVVPFNSAIIANEKMGIYAYLGIAESIMRLLVALVLTFCHLSADKLIIYALLWMIATFLLQGSAILFCRRNFEECRFRRFFERGLFKEMFSFAGWSFLESIAGTFSGQGVNVMLNIFFGTVVNAARGLAGTVNNAVSIFVNNFIMALNPQITQSYASGDLGYLKSLVFRGTKFSFFILIFFAIPLFLETPFVLHLWLGEVPEHTANFVRLTLIISVIDLHGGIFNMAQKATGDIRTIQIWLSLSTLSIFPLSYVALKCGLSPEYVYLVSILVSLLKVCVILITVCKKLSFSMREILATVYLKMDIVTLLSLPIPILCHIMLPEGWWRLVAVTASSIVFIACFVWSIGSTKIERATLLNHLLKKLNVGGQ